MAGRKFGAKGKQKPHTVRLKRAVFIVALCAVVLGTACFLPKIVSSLSDSSMASNGSYVAQMTRQAILNVDLRENLTQMGFALVDESSPPSWFEEEIISCSELSDGVAMPDWSTVGFCKQGEVQEVLETLSYEFTKRGWRGYSSGISGVATFIKEEGVCTWMMVSCIEEVDIISVVLQIRHV